jgi:hypothetical protein
VSHLRPTEDLSKAECRLRRELRSASRPLTNPSRRSSEPILLRSEITRDQVLAYFISQAGEAVVDGPGAYAIDTADAEGIAVLAAAAEPMIAEGEKRSERIKAEIMAASEDELFGEWAGRAATLPHRAATYTFSLTLLLKCDGRISVGGVGCQMVSRTSLRTGPAW